MVTQDRWCPSITHKVLGQKLQADMFGDNVPDVRIGYSNKRAFEAISSKKDKAPKAVCFDLTFPKYLLDGSG